MNAFMYAKRKLIVYIGIVFFALHILITNDVFLQKKFIYFEKSCVPQDACNFGLESPPHIII